MPGFAVTCDVELVVMGSAGQRIVAAREFFLGPLETVLRPDEIIVEARIPAWQPGRRWGFEEFARRRGDFALAGIAVFFDEDAAGHMSNAHVGAIGAASYPRRLVAVEDLLNGQIATAEVIEAAGQAAGAAVDPMDDLHGSVEYRRALVSTLTERALRHAAGLH
jgi:carbon-monoxide dehydrogenase medium subunit